MKSKLNSTRDGNRSGGLLRSWLGVTMLCALATCAVAAKPAPPALTVESVLEELDSAAKQFHSLTATVERTKVTVVVNDRSTESGQIYVRRDGKMRLDLTAPDERTILRNGDNLYVYNPRIKRVEEFNLAQHREMVEQFLLLGFGTSGKQLEKGYDATLLEEQSLDGHRVALLELIPRSRGVREQISKIQLWIDEGTWMPIQQKFFEAGTQDYFLIKYTNIVRNAKIRESRFKPHWPKGTTKVKPEG